MKDKSLFLFLPLSIMARKSSLLHITPSPLTHSLTHSRLSSWLSVAFWHFARCLPKGKKIACFFYGTCDFAKKRVNNSLVYYNGPAMGTKPVGRRRRRRRGREGGGGGGPQEVSGYCTSESFFSCWPADEVSSFQKLSQKLQQDSDMPTYQIKLLCRF